MKRTLIATFALGVLLASSARADDDFYGPVTHQATKDECGACHMAFQPGLLPADSWKAVMADLPNHFGEDASLPAETATEIEAYLVANAGTNGFWQRFTGGKEVTLRITDLPDWKHEHEEEVSPSAWTRADVGSKANCPACHKAAEKGYYDDD
ncbi:diheme cytochrome c [Magnetospira sp. QH-2]|uniref:diheme cytochrome c n=1 Tax=Magnetospira sp. (strain QH-2) TaxID=1288970 RepID=UPI0003E817FB|nr:diheme cytochrome c [Magnetospira sp. QH-2]CCQ75062.1 putative diheme cytochrome c [Magnetospira sp. QH-2]